MDIVRSLRYRLSRFRNRHFPGLTFRHGSLPLPSGTDRESILGTLSSLTIDGALIPELRSYLEGDLDRFLYTMDLIEPDRSGKALEIGANPYFMSALMRTYRSGLAFDYLNYFEGSGEWIHQNVRWNAKDGSAFEIDARCFNVNIEAGTIPVADAEYDLVMFCEVLEHFTMNPLAAVRELSRVLKPGGHLILTTPNVARMENVMAMLEGRNIYDPYSGYGPHGRHNREYSRHELHQLMNYAGFSCERDFTSDVQRHVAVSRELSTGATSLLGSVPRREFDLGQYLFSRWVKVSETPKELPRWLYRSYPESQMTP